MANGKLAIRSEAQDQRALHEDQVNQKRPRDEPPSSQGHEKASLKKPRNNQEFIPEVKTEVEDDTYGISRQGPNKPVDRPLNISAEDTRRQPRLKSEGNHDIPQREIKLEIQDRGGRARVAGNPADQSPAQSNNPRPGGAVESPVQRAEIPNEEAPSPASQSIVPRGAAPLADPRLGRTRGRPRLQRQSEPFTSKLDEVVELMYRLRAFGEDEVDRCRKAMVEVQSKFQSASDRINELADAQKSQEKRIAKAKRDLEATEIYGEHLRVWLDTCPPTEHWKDGEVEIEFHEEIEEIMAKMSKPGRQTVKGLEELRAGLRDLAREQSKLEEQMARLQADGEMLKSDEAEYERGLGVMNGGLLGALNANDDAKDSSKDSAGYSEDESADDGDSEDGS